MYKELVVILNLADTKKVFEDQGAETELRDSVEFSKYINAEMVKWGKVVREAKIQGE
jgi:tripartite-type tricarboxylate transporter receptor subunit TctC